MNKITFFGASKDNKNNIDYTYKHWGPFVFLTKLDDEIILELLERGKQAKQSHNHKLAGHIKHQYRYEKESENWFFENVQSYFEAYRDGHCKFHGLPNLPIQLEPLNLWINFMKPGDFNPAHYHGGSYSFVIFLTMPENLTEEQKEHEGTGAPPGSLIFSYGEATRPRWVTNGMEHVPKVGDFVIFPSLLQHWVAPFKSKGERISISGNLNLLHNHGNTYF